MRESATAASCFGMPLVEQDTYHVRNGVFVSALSRPAARRHLNRRTSSAHIRFVIPVLSGAIANLVSVSIV